MTLNEKFAKITTSGKIISWEFEAAVDKEYKRVFGLLIKKSQVYYLPLYFAGSPPPLSTRGISALAGQAGKDFFFNPDTNNILKRTGIGDDWDSHEKYETE